MSYLPRLTMVCGLNAHIGYGAHAFRIVRDFEAMGIDVNIRPINQVCLYGSSIPPWVQQRIVHREQQEDWELLLTAPHECPTPGKKVAYFTMWESSRISQRSVDMINMAVCLIVPCQWNRVGFQESGVTIPIHVVPLGVDIPPFEMIDHGPTESCVFGVAGQLANGRTRKGVYQTIECFTKEFRTEKDVRLRVKVMPGEIGQFTDSRIQVIGGFMDEIEWAEWYRSLTALVAPSKGEGWGLIVHEAMSVGRPVLCPLYGGLAEFVTSECGYPIDFVEGPAGDHCKDLGVWCEPKDESVMLQMRKVYNNRKAAQLKGRYASHQARAFTWRKANEDLMNVLKECGVFDR